MQEYIALSQEIRKVIPFMSLMNEVYFIFNIHLPKTAVFYKIFKDNQICIAVVESTRLSLRKKPITIKYHNL